MDVEDCEGDWELDEVQILEGRQVVETELHVVLCTVGRVGDEADMVFTFHFIVNQFEFLGCVVQVGIQRDDFVEHFWEGSEEGRTLSDSQERVDQQLVESVEVVVGEVERRDQSE